MKFDGYRAQIAVSGSEVRVYTHNGHDWTQQFKVILPPLISLTKGSLLLDGEIVAIDKAGRTNFSMLKSGIAAGIPLKLRWFERLAAHAKELLDLEAGARGRMLPTGGQDHGHKGYGMALMVEALGQGRSGYGRSHPGRRRSASVYVQVMDPALFAAVRRSASRPAQLPISVAARGPATLPGQSGCRDSPEVPQTGRSNSIRTFGMPFAFGRSG